ncbi:hypothetical protein PSEUBRA_001972 [Kalmanozyma brasiliensis GHG001]|uniref:Zinc-finger domain-containing protein n=1 Tax=Kalmanozyma brasiliensis (strain GHG001) TaxID=1365824 RepID=V5EDM1_KALBG|nr:uncharacterized protein PSEUBRA_001972 [Kalmanozyma brasiliensis GHG001]EST08546.1 hypothetical protein PSEUBRA_001972 [Kalmanozyma brasiliensis GHG001]
MAAAPDSSVLVDLTADDDSLSELSDAPDPLPSTSSSKAKPKSKSSSAKAALTKSASSSNLAGPKATTKPKARKSEPTTASKTNGAEHTPAKGKAKENGSASKAPHPRSTPISDAVRARTHVNVEGEVQKKCHQHHQNCKGPLLECTFMRAPGKRCQGRYCFSSLKRFYDQDPETIVKSNRMMINPEEHCPPSEAKYAWKCPRCRGKCACSTCRKARGLEPLGKWSTSKSSTGTTEAGDDSTSKSKSKTNGDAAAQPETSKKASTKGKGKNIAEAMAAGKTNGKGKAKSDAIDVDADEDDGVNTPPPPGSRKPAPKKTLASILSANTIRAPAFKTFKPPAETAPPTLEVIPTKLPEDNMRARMWIYESMVRFDKFGLNRGVLSQLDRFEHWTHTMVQDMLACLLKTIAGMSNIERGQPTKPFVKAITAFRSHGKNLQRGEPWAAATELLTILGLARTPLAFVEHDIPVEVEAAAAHRSPSPPPAARVTRARRAKEGNQYEIARQLSLLDQWEEDEFGETAGDADEDDEDALPSKRRRGTTKKSIYVYDEPSDDESMADPDDSSRARRSGRSRRAAEKEPAPEVRLTGRQQAIKLQQEQQKEEEAAAAAQQKEEEHVAASRKRRASSGSIVNGTASIASDDEDADQHNKPRTNGNSHDKRRKLVAGSSDDEAESDVDGDDSKVKDDVETDEKDTSIVEQDQEDLESPDLETKVSILSALIDAAVMAENVAEELKLAADNMVSLDRAQKVANAEMEKEIVEELADLNKRAPSIVSPEYQKWKAEKAALEQDHAWRRQDARVTAELAIDVHALRTGPLGIDADGREYWHLREYQERMPKFTEGRHAWCLVVLGKAFPADPNQPKEAKEDAGDVSMAEVGDKTKEEKNEADDSGLTSLDASTDNDDADDGAKKVQLGLPTSKGGANGQVDAATEARICMGTNDASTIKTLVDYITFRLERVEYEENIELQDREKLARMVKEGDSSDASDTAPSMYSIRKAKQTLKDTQEERRRQVEQLVKRLTKTKEYFAWHREELAP